MTNDYDIVCDVYGFWRIMDEISGEQYNMAFDTYEEALLYFTENPDLFPDSGFFE